MRRQADEAGSGVRSTVVPDEGSGETADRTINYPGKRFTVMPEEGSSDMSGPSITQVRGLQSGEGSGDTSGSSLISQVRGLKSGQMREVVTCLGHRLPR